MFGDLMGLMGNLRDTQQKVEETKKRMDTVFIEETSSDSFLKITITANSEIKKIDISESLLEDKEQLEDYLIVTLNKAIKKAITINEEEIAAVAKKGLPDIPGFNL